mmetsp:Transcript_63732/g.207011  ORF Transcript_63732/g.207011 Transcript_63732/m.207011 type:complete len:243 (+) Transcript_63732:1616-2344(+)
MSACACRRNNEVDVQKNERRKPAELSWPMPAPLMLAHGSHNAWEVPAFGKVTKNRACKVVVESDTSALVAPKSLTMPKLRCGATSGSSLSLYGKALTTPPRAATAHGSYKPSLSSSMPADASNSPASSGPSFDATDDGPTGSEASPRKISNGSSSAPVPHDCGNSFTSGAEGPASRPALPPHEGAPAPAIATAAAAAPRLGGGRPRPASEAAEARAARLRQGTPLRGFDCQLRAALARDMRR